MEVFYHAPCYLLCLHKGLTEKAGQTFGLTPGYHIGQEVLILTFEALCSLATGEGCEEAHDGGVGDGADWNGRGGGIKEGYLVAMATPANTQKGGCGPGLDEMKCHRLGAAAGMSECGCIPPHRAWGQATSKD